MGQLQVMNLCRVPWRLAAYLKDVGQTQARSEGIYNVMKAQKEFFEGILMNGNRGMQAQDSNGHPNDLFKRVSTLSPALMRTLSAKGNCMNRFCA